MSRHIAGKTKDLPQTTGYTQDSTDWTSDRNPEGTVLRCPQRINARTNKEQVIQLAAV